MAGVSDRLSAAFLWQLAVGMAVCEARLMSVIVCQQHSFGGGLLA
jgi:hypothetical protein